MIIYSPIPLEEIFKGIESEVTAPEELDWKGVKMEVHPLNRYQAKIIRLLSHNPQDFLDPRLSPGQVIDFRD